MGFIAISTVDPTPGWPMLLGVLILAGIALGVALALVLFLIRAVL